MPNDFANFPARDPRAQDVTKLVQRDDEKQSQILGDIPVNRGVRLRSVANLVCGHEKPGPMQKNINSSEAEEENRSLASIHTQTYNTSAGQTIYRQATQPDR